jgi:hypothetical protein
LLLDVRPVRDIDSRNARPASWSFLVIFDQVMAAFPGVTSRAQYGIGRSRTGVEGAADAFTLF